MSSTTRRYTSREARSTGEPSGQFGVARQIRHPERQGSVRIVDGSGWTIRSAAPVRIPNRS
jgi:hypothetical protein